MSETGLRITVADAPAARAVHPVIERAYRGDSARAGWTHEADLLETPRTSADELAALATSPNSRLLVAWLEGRPAGSVAITNCGGNRCYIGMLAIDPQLQAGGYGRHLLSAAEATAKSCFGAETVEMTVISTRTSLIDYYQRRGFTLTGEQRPFPDPRHPELAMVVLERALA